MTPRSNDYEMLPQSDNEQDADMTINEFDQPPASPHTIPPSDRHQPIMQYQRKASASTLSTPPPEPWSSTTPRALAARLMLSRYFSVLFQNPFLVLLAELFNSSSPRHSLNLVPLSSFPRSNQNLNSPYSSGPQTPEISCAVSPTVSLAEDTETLPDTDVEMLPSPVFSPLQAWDTQSDSPDIRGPESRIPLSLNDTALERSSEQDFSSVMSVKQAENGNIEIRCAEKEQTFDTKLKHSNDSDTESKSMERFQEDNTRQESASNDQNDSEDNCSVSDSKKQTLAPQDESLSQDAADDDVTMRDSQTAIMSPLLTSNSSVRERVAEVLIKKRRMRGLENNGNTCFINVILQSLLSCDLFRKLALSREAEEGMLLEKFGHLAWEMTEEAASKSILNDFSSDATLLPKGFFGIFKPSETIADRHSGTQEDAEEFLSFLLNKLQDEEVARGKGQAPGEKSDACSGWEKSDQGQRFVDTSISKVFGGSSVSEVRRTSQKPSLTEASFFSLSLDVDSDSVNSIPDALNNYYATEIISNEAGKDGKEMKIEKQLFVTEAPQILILHLKRFACDGITFAPKKVMKEIKFPEVLELPDSIMRESENGGEKRKEYELMAVVTHLGTRLAGGHYFCDVRFKNMDGGSIWVKCDDETLKIIEVDEVLRRDAYVLFYCAV